MYVDKIVSVEIRKESGRAGFFGLPQNSIKPFKKGNRMTRREIREQIFTMLFQVEFHEEEELKGQMQYQTAENEEDKDALYIQNKIDDIVAKIPELDELINSVAKGWKTNRMAKVDLTLIRLAVYEIRYEESIPTGVAINEAVELAKKYGTDDSPSFVNGILAKLA